MTLFHFGNCVALAYVPYLLTYKYSGLSEYGAFWKCVQAAAMYIVMQLCKMLILATFFPPGDVSSVGGFDVLGEFLKATVDLADLVGIHVVMTKVAGKGETKFLVAGLGWASAELLMTRFVPLWVGARGMEFDWRYVQLSFDSNISLVNHITTATLVWLWNRNDLRKVHLPVVTVLLAITCYRSLILELMVQTLAFGPWLVLAVKLLGAVSVGLAALHIYLSLTQSLNAY
ncbi:membrane protein, putative [Ixodes scapularis]|uniref:BOS complex subunit TMEM147 n=1 Tax=Ixodes scapularis TaxID=6945 RepID=B7PP57_IXOSC|nr:membrane protein, putative [Ixodes scapularis]|eukprot:XP_002435549.1 membrane protein, putative [Ixodes scapularis]